MLWVLYTQNKMTEFLHNNSRSVVILEWRRIIVYSCITTVYAVRYTSKIAGFLPEMNIIGPDLVLP